MWVEAYPLLNQEATTVAEVLVKNLQPNLSSFDAAFRSKAEL